jgi:WD40 repeat protein
VYIKKKFDNEQDDMRRYKLLLLLAIALLIGPAELLSFIEIQVQQISFSSVISFSEYPKIKSYLIVFKDGTEITPDPMDIIVIEDSRAVFAESVTRKSDGWLEVKWHSTSRGFNESNPVEFIVSSGNDVGYSLNSFSSFNPPKVLIKERYGQVIEEMYFGRAGAGSTIYKQIKVHALKGRFDSEGFEKPVRIDSLKVSSTDFVYTWQGNEFTQQPPPVSVPIGSLSLVDLVFKPTQNKLYRDKLTIFYEQGLKEELLLTANRATIENNTVLKLLQPIGGEILTPCEYYPIRWKGFVRDIPTKVFFSNDGGGSWVEIGSSMDSTLSWLVPNEITNFGKIKVKQEFSSTGREILSNEQNGIYRIKYSPDGLNLLSSDNDGMILNWDMISKTKSGKYSINNSLDFQADYRIFGMAYLEGKTKFVVAYDANNGSGYGQDTLAYFDVAGGEYPFEKVPVPSGFSTKDMYIDSTGTMLILSPSLGKQLLVLSAMDGSLIRYVDFDHPIGSVTVNETAPQLAVYKYNSKIEVLSLPNFEKQYEVPVGDMPIVLEMALSPNQKYLAIGCKTPATTPTSIASTQIHVLDLAAGDIVRTLKKTASDPRGLEFNPTSTVLVVGSKFNPQIAFWDLVADEFIGSLGGSISELTDFDFSPEGHSVAVSTASNEKLILQSFTYPEENQSEGFFRIVGPKVELTGSPINKAYLGTENNYEFQNVLCNTGESNITIDNISLKEGIHFRLVGVNVPFTLHPKECMNIKFIYQPLDTGYVRDTVVFSSNCFGAYRLPLEAYSINRTITILNNTIDFGETCVSDTTTRMFNLIRNEDPVPLKLNYLKLLSDGYLPFEAINSPVDLEIAPGGVLALDLRFMPLETKVYLGEIQYFHSGQTKIYSKNELTGKGIGTLLNSSHAELLYIPEIPARKIKLTNTGDNIITIESASVIPPGNYEVLSSLPIQIGGKGESELEVRWTGKDRESAFLHLKATPCVSFIDVKLGFYEGISTVTIPTVEADPRQEVIIPINYTNKGNGNYAGERFFEAEFKVNPKLFLPLEVTSDFGVGSLLRNEIVGGERVIGLRVEGNFPDNGTAALIRGIPGLAETDTSSLILIPGSVFWGENVVATPENGLLKIVSDCPDRRIIHDDSPLTKLSVNPNPADDFTIVSFEAIRDFIYQTEVLTTVGERIIDLGTNQAITGENELSLGLNQLPAGIYSLIIRSGNYIYSHQFVVIR